MESSENDEAASVFTPDTVADLDFASEVLEQGGDAETAALISADGQPERQVVIDRREDGTIVYRRKASIMTSAARRELIVPTNRFYSSARMPWASTTRA